MFVQQTNQCGCFPCNFNFLVNLSSGVSLPSTPGGARIILPHRQSEYPLWFLTLGPWNIKIRNNSLFTRVVDKRVPFLFLFSLKKKKRKKKRKKRSKPALAQTRDYSRSSYTCTHFLSCRTPVHTWNKRSLDIKHDTRQRGRWVDRGYTSV